MTVGIAAHLRGVSKDSLRAAEESLEALAASGDAETLGEELFAIAGVIGSNAGLRRGLTDAARSPHARAELATRLFGDKVSQPALQSLVGLAKARWAQPADLTDAVEHLGVTSVLAAAERDRALDDVEDELFRLGRAIAGNGELRDALAARTPGVRRKEDLIRALVAGKVRTQTLALAVHAVTASRGRRPERVIDGYVAIAAARRNRYVADIVTAVPLTSQQHDRLAGALARIYGNAVRLNVRVDPEVVGGLRIRLGGEVLDGTLVTRLAAARRRLAG